MQYAIKKLWHDMLKNMDMAQSADAEYMEIFMGLHQAVMSTMRLLSKHTDLDGDEEILLKDGVTYPKEQALKMGAQSVSIYMKKIRKSQ